jgi:hypothetical protein
MEKEKCVCACVYVSTGIYACVCVCVCVCARAQIGAVRSIISSPGTSSVEEGLPVLARMYADAKTHSPKHTDTHTHTHTHTAQLSDSASRLRRRIIRVHGKTTNRASGCASHTLHTSHADQPCRHPPVALACDNLHDSLPCLRRGCHRERQGATRSARASSLGPNVYLLLKIDKQTQMV